MHHNHIWVVLQYAVKESPLTLRHLVCNAHVTPPPPKKKKINRQINKIKIIIKNTGLKKIISTKNKFSITFVHYCTSYFERNNSPNIKADIPTNHTISLRIQRANEDCQAFPIFSLVPEKIHCKVSQRNFFQ